MPSLENSQEEYYEVYLEHKRIDVQTGEEVWAPGLADGQLGRFMLRYDYGEDEAFRFKCRTKLEMYLIRSRLHNIIRNAGELVEMERMFNNGCRWELREEELDCGIHIFTERELVRNTMYDNGVTRVTWAYHGLE